MRTVTNIEQQPEQQFIYAGNLYLIKGDTLYKAYYENNGNQLNGFFKKIFKGIGKVVKKVVKSPILGIALTAASGGAFGVLSAGQLMAVNVAKGVTGLSGLINTRNDLKKQAAVDKANEMYYAAQIKIVDDQIKAAGGTVPTDLTATTLPVTTNAEGTKAIQAYAAYINAGGDPASLGKALPNVTAFGGLTPSLLVAGGVGLMGVILISNSMSRR